MAALLLRDLVTVGASPWAEPYSPRRLKPLASGLPIARENLEIGWHFVADRLRTPATRPELGLDQGRIERSGRQQVAVYRDLRGDLHFLSPRCPHLGCIVALERGREDVGLPVPRRPLRADRQGALRAPRPRASRTSRRATAAEGAGRGPERRACPGARSARRSRAMPGEPQPSATVVVLRDGPRGLEVLLLERVPDADGKTGPSVFPGGRVDPGDRDGDALDDAAFRRAAIREAREEAGLDLDATGLVPISRWITPEASPKRFDTWFYFACVADGAEVNVDGSEIARHQWMTPGDAIDAHHRDAIRLAPPTFVTVTWLAELASVSAARERFRGDALARHRTSS